VSTKSGRTLAGLGSVKSWPDFGRTLFANQHQLGSIWTDLYPDLPSGRTHTPIEGGGTSGEIVLVRREGRPSALRTLPELAVLKKTNWPTVPAHGPTSKVGLESNITIAQASRLTTPAISAQRRMFSAARVRHWAPAFVASAQSAKPAGFRGCSSAHSAESHAHARARDFGAEISGSLAEPRRLGGPP
jgi:hypothetical protein